MNRGQLYDRKKDFVENDLANVMTAKQDFDRIQYAHSNSTEGEYIRICDILGRSVTLNVTAFTIEQILEAVCRIVVITSDAPAAADIIDDIEDLRKIAPLFR